jgi:hypothetical protein
MSHVNCRGCVQFYPILNQNLQRPRRSPHPNAGGCYTKSSLVLSNHLELQLESGSISLALRGYRSHADHFDFVSHLTSSCGRATERRRNVDACLRPSKPSPRRRSAQLARCTAAASKRVHLWKALGCSWPVESGCSSHPPFLIDLFIRVQKALVQPQSPL